MLRRKQTALLAAGVMRVRQMLVRGSGAPEGARRFKVQLTYFVLAAFASAATALFESCDEFMNFVTTSVMAPATASP